MSVTVEGYKRFEDETVVDVAPTVVALIGPNEAGKSSLLVAMMLLNRETEIDPVLKSRGSSKEVSVEARYLLDAGDWAALAKVPGGSAIRSYTHERRLQGGETKSFYTLSPVPKRNISTRHRRAVELERFVNQETILDRFHGANSVRVPDAYDAALAALKSSGDSLNDVEVAAIERFADTMLTFPDIEPKPNRAPDAETVSIHFWKLMQELVNYREGRSPSAEAAAILGGRRPEFVLFTEEDRDLRTAYHLESEVADPPKALGNLARLAELDLGELHSYASPASAGQRTTLLHRANDRLKERFKDIWPQLDLTGRIDFNQPNLEITVSAPGNSFNLVTERSDGLRSFVALRAFLAKHRTNQPPVLLVDEAETHLHYDAQANLVDMFTKQSLAAKVIYTTHSAGCLPMDLGNGIRVVAPQPGQERSVVRKSIWDGKFAGFTPLVFAMGASTFAFLPSRNVLMAEGESDAMILPTLLRESAGAAVLPFQVAPGIANSSVAQASLLKHEGASVMYLTDGDQGGRELHQKLTNANVKRANILDLGSYFWPDCVLEDLIDPNVYVEAVNWVISTYQPGKPLVQASDLPTPKRTDRLRSWCQTNAVKVPDKVVVCQRLLDRKAEAAGEGGDIRLLDSGSKAKLGKLTRQLVKRFPQAPAYGSPETGTAGNN